MALPRPSHYKEVFTPALHRRFTGSALVAFILCYLVGILIAEKSSLFWLWFPLGFATIRALLLFLCTIPLLLLRMGWTHLGKRTSNSPSSTFLNEACKINTLQISACYILTAWWFSEVYIWSAPASAELGWFTRGSAFERGKLNEKPIYIRWWFMVLALSQGLFDLLDDYSFLPLDITPSRGEPIASQPGGTLQSIYSRVKILTPMLKWDGTSFTRSIRQNVVVRVLVISVLYTLLYMFFIRRTVWGWSMSFTSLIWNLPPQRLSILPPHYPSLLYRSFTSGLQLLVLWQSSNALFRAYVSQQPIKKGQPLSADSSNPTETLLNGLKSRKETVKTFATWELSILTANFPDRRKAIFTDIDRPAGAAWSQIVEACLGNIISISDRINDFLKPNPPPNQPPAPVDPLPQISTPLPRDNILTKPPQAPNTPLVMSVKLGRVGFSYEQPPQDPSKSPDSFTETKSIFSTLWAALPWEAINVYLMKLLRSPLGHPFRQTFKRRVTATVLGSPYSTYYTTICSIKVLSALAVASIDEDPYGRVSKDVPALIRTFTASIQNIEAFMANLQPHWTDVEFAEGNRWVSDVADVVSCLKDGLGAMLDTFGKYASELDMSQSDVGLARKATEVRRLEGENESGNERPVENGVALER